MMEGRNDGILEYWSSGIMEEWNVGMLGLRDE